MEAGEVVFTAEGEAEGQVPLGLMDKHQMEEREGLDLLGLMASPALAVAEVHATAALLALVALVVGAMAALMQQSEQGMLILGVAAEARTTARMLLLAALAL